MIVSWIETEEFFALIYFMKIMAIKTSSWYRSFCIFSSISAVVSLIVSFPVFADNYPPTSFVSKKTYRVLNDCREEWRMTSMMTSLGFLFFSFSLLLLCCFSFSFPLSLSGSFSFSFIFNFRSKRPPMLPPTQLTFGERKKRSHHSWTHKLVNTRTNSHRHPERKK